MRYLISLHLVKDDDSETARELSTQRRHAKKRQLQLLEKRWHHNTMRALLK